jgi:hypothetical protein
MCTPTPPSEESDLDEEDDNDQDSRDCLSQSTNAQPSNATLVVPKRKKKKTSTADTELQELINKLTEKAERQS